MLNRKFFFGAAIVILAAAACQKAEPESAVDTKPLPITENKDLTTQPGDDFWQYCNGAWDAKTPAPATGAVGGLYDMGPVMSAMELSIIAEDPSLKHYFQLRDEKYDHPEESLAFLQSLEAKYPASETREDALRTFGKLTMDGLCPLSLELINDWKDGEIIALFAIAGTTYKYSFDDLGVKDPELQSTLRYILEGMELDTDKVYFNDITVGILEAIKTEPVETLNTVNLMGFVKLYPFWNQDGLAIYNLYNPHAQMTAESVDLWSRAYCSYLISNRLAEKHISPELKQHFKDLTEKLRTAFRARIAGNTWMSETTKNNALEKLDKMMVFVGSPDHWYEDCLPDLTQCKSFVEAVYILKQCTPRLYKHLLGTQDVFSNSIMMVSPVLGKPTVADLTMLNSYYRREYNSIVILPCVMLPPFIKEEYSEAYEYSRISVEAHEITHGFDSDGAKYDAVGRKKNWWTVADKMAFEDEQKKLIDCYNNMEFDPFNYSGQYQDGKRTLSENIADLGGFLIVQDAYIARLKELGFSGNNLTDQLKKLYESYANLYGMKYSPEKIQSFLTEDVHSHGRLRVNGVVANCDLWYDLYDVNRNNFLYLPVERRTYIW